MKLHSELQDRTIEPAKCSHDPGIERSPSIAGRGLHCYPLNNLLFPDNLLIGYRNSGSGNGVSNGLRNIDSEAGNGNGLT